MEQKQTVEEAQPKLSARQILFDHGIDILRFEDDFNTNLFMAMERYAEQGPYDAQKNILSSKLGAASLPTNSMQWVSELIEDYKRRLATVKKMMAQEVNSIDSVTASRLSAKASCYRTFISELERELPSAPTEPKQ